MTSITRDLLIGTVLIQNVMKDFMRHRKNVVLLLSLFLSFYSALLEYLVSVAVTNTKRKVKINLEMKLQRN